MTVFTIPEPYVSEKGSARVPRTRSMRRGGAVDQMKIHACSLVDITDGTFLSYTTVKLTRNVG